MRDLTDQRFGKLVAIRPTDQRKNHYIMWECRCDCGNTVYVSSHNLTSNKKRSCGCDSGKRRKKPIIRQDTLVGKRFGKLVVLEPTDQRVKKCIVWKCQCDCGNITFKNTNLLRNGYAKSCGCLKQENADKRTDERARQLIGQRFGRLTIMAPTKERVRNAVLWECKCDCGNTTYAPLFTLKDGSKSSCGCKARERTAQGREKLERELVGQKFGRLTVLRAVENQRNWKTELECQCDCGNITFAAKYDLIHGIRKSCGCLKKEQKEQDRKKWQERELGQRYGRLTVLRLSEERINNAIVWECQCDCGNLTLATLYQLKKGLKKSCGCLLRKIKLPDSLDSHSDLPKE